MDFDAVLARLAECHELGKLLTLAQLAEIFGQQKSTVYGWRKTYGFPADCRPFDISTRTATRYWRPDEVIEWTRLRQHIDLDGADIDEVCAMVGVHRETWVDWIKAERAPPHRWLALGTGRQLWNRDEVKAWLQERTGGYSIPQPTRRAVPVSRTARRSPRGRRRKSEAVKESRP